jgi:UDP-N-acetylmuramate--alanine ligase
MSGIAEVLLSRGDAVSGSDLARGPVTDRLASLGARIAIGHAADHARGADVVVASSAVSDDNPELVEARSRGVPVIPRAQMLAELMRGRRGIAVAGSHGKTTTTSLVAAVLEAGGLDPTVIVGGRLDRLGSGARVGAGAFFVAEADESDRSFLRLSPEIAVVTNIDREHLEAYAGMQDLEAAFARFADSVPEGGASVVCSDDPVVARLLPRLERRVVAYGLAPGAAVTASDVELLPTATHYTARSHDAPLGRVRLPLPGLHNVRNSLAALATGLELELCFDGIREGLEAFAGVSRRFEIRGEAAGVCVVDDYGHHPVEIRATLESLSRFAGSRRRVVVFQPHRYSRTRALWDDFVAAFDGVDRLLVCDVYAAGEPPLPGADARRLAAAIRERGVEAEAAGDAAAAAERLAGSVAPGDVVLTLGAGDVWRAGAALLEARGEDA